MHIIANARGNPLFIDKTQVRGLRRHVVPVFSTERRARRFRAAFPQLTCDQILPIDSVFLQTYLCTRNFGSVRDDVAFALAKRGERGSKNV